MGTVCYVCVVNFQCLKKRREGQLDHAERIPFGLGHLKAPLMMRRKTGDW